MITNNEVMTKLNALKNYSVAESTATESLFQPLEDAISLYFGSSCSELTTALEDVVKYMYNDISRRTTEHEKNFNMNLSSDFPKGYDDITKCFYTFEELMKVDNTTFFNAFVQETDPTTGLTGYVSNPYLDKWTSEITQAVTGDLENVKKLAEWCKNSGGSSDLISLLEEQGQITKSLSMKEIATIIYQEKKLIDVIRSKNLKVYKPSWMV